MKLNEKGEELFDVWEQKFWNENDRLGGDSKSGIFVVDTDIVNKKNCIKTITDECGWLIFTYDEYVFDVLDEWADDCGETDNCCAGFTIAEVRKELLKYFE